MDFKKLLETQKILDERIVKEKGLEGVNLLDKKILALLVELGELANEWQRFKFWKENNEPRTWVRYIDHCTTCNAEGEIHGNKCTECDGYGDHGVGYKNPLLEEYVDCLHFILSIGNDLGIYGKWDYQDLGFIREKNTESQFIGLFKSIKNYMSINDWLEVLERFIPLSDMLGFTLDQVEQAYYDKNKINHARQENNY